MQVQISYETTPKEKELKVTITSHITITLNDIAIATKHTLSDYYDPILDSDIQPDFLEATDTVTNKLEEKIDEKIYDELAEEKITTTIVSQRSLQELIAKVMEEALGGKYLYVPTLRQTIVRHACPAQILPKPTRRVEQDTKRMVPALVDYRKLYRSQKNSTLAAR